MTELKIKNRLKTSFYYKVSVVLNLIEQLRDKGLKMAFDNMQTNNYKLLYRDNVYVFTTYDDVIECLELIIDIGGERI